MDHPVFSDVFASNLRAIVLHLFYAPCSSPANTVVFSQVVLIEVDQMKSVDKTSAIVDMVAQCFTSRICRFRVGAPLFNALFLSINVKKRSVL